MSQEKYSGLPFDNVFGAGELNSYSLGDPATIEKLETLRSYLGGGFELLLSAMGKEYQSAEEFAQGLDDLRQALAVIRDSGKMAEDIGL